MAGAQHWANSRRKRDEEHSPNHKTDLYRRVAKTISHSLEYDSEWQESASRLKTEFLHDVSKSIISENDSPDVGFRYSLNPYRGCEHGCAYCYARPTHEYLGHSAGLDFESKIYVKHRAPKLFREWLARPRWKPETIAFSGVTDCYQPAERRFLLTRQCLQVACEALQPVVIVTKNALVSRDLDFLRPMAEAKHRLRRDQPDHAG